MSYGLLVEGVITVDAFFLYLVFFFMNDVFFMNVITVA